MKYLHFLQWKWQKASLTDKMWWIGLTFMMLGLVNDFKWILLAGGVIFFILFFKFFVYDRIIESYKEYEQEQTQLIEILRTTKNDDVL